MPCYHPLKAYIIGQSVETGKDKLLVKPYTYDMPGIPYKEIPCGKCIGCRLEYSRQWANRLMLEYEYHQEAYFLTLTYNDENVPIVHYKDALTDDLGDAMTLNLRDVQLFMKRLRKSQDELGYKLRFFLSGEYGPSTFRPHYHAIIFGLHLDDLKLYKFNDMMQRLYTSEYLEKLWSKGFVTVGECSWSTCAYVARYVTKKLTGKDKQIYERFQILPPFSVMSRRPGIGFQWYADHPDCLDYEYINLKTPERGLKFRPPRYFEMLYEKEFPEDAQIRKDARRTIAESSKILKGLVTDKNYLAILASEEYNLEQKLKILDRSECD